MEWSPLYNLPIYSSNLPWYDIEVPCRYMVVDTLDECLVGSDHDSHILHV